MSSEFEFEPVDSCMLCGSGQQHDAQGISMQGVAFSYCYCGRCGLKYMRPRPTLASYARFYQEAYWTEIVEGRTYPTTAGADDPRLDQMKLRESKYRRVYELVRQDLLSVGALVPRARVLEVGCGFGFTLEWLADEFDCQVFGVEPGEEALRRCAQAPRITIVARTAEEYLAGVSDDGQPEQYDVILFRQCLENMVDPRAVLLGARARLGDRGVLLVYTPNVEYYDIMNPYHPFIYSPETITRLLRVCGLEVSRVKASPSPVDHATAVSVVNPSPEIAVIAKRGAVDGVAARQIDPIQLAACHKRGQQVMAWSKLSTADMARRITLRAGSKLRRSVLGAGR